MDAGLHENGEPCPASALRREDHDLGEVFRPEVSCNMCGGTGRVGFAVETVVAKHVGWARKHYWPERERMWAIQNAGIAG